MKKKQAIAELWRRGDLNYKLNESQAELYSEIMEGTDKISTSITCRRFGKSYVLLTGGVSTCIKKEKARVSFICPLTRWIKTNVLYLMREILKDCPDSLKPVWRENEKCFKFPNGSILQITGTENYAYESLRGASSDLCLIDEAAFCFDLKEVVYSVLLPSTFTTNGRIVMASSLSKKPKNDFNIEFVKKYVDKVSVYDINTCCLDEDTKKQIVECYGENSEDYKRDYLCKMEGVL